jgi:large repetitive protein
MKAERTVLSSRLTKRKGSRPKHAGGAVKKVALLAVLALFLILALPGGPAMAASVTADGTASSTIIAANATSATFSHTTGTGSNRLLMVGVSWNCGTTDRSISSVTFTPSGGSAQALTMKITQLGYNSSNPRYSAIYYLVGPPSGTTGDITITFSGTVSNGGVAGAADFAGVDPATPLGTAVGSTSSSTGTAISQALSGLNGNEMVFDNVFAGSSGTSTTLTAGASQTQEWSVNGYTGSTNPVNCIAGASYQQATSSSLTMSWTLATTAARWCIAAVPNTP